MFRLPPWESDGQTRAESTAASGTDAARTPAEARHRFDDQATTPRSDRSICAPLQSLSPGLRAGPMSLPRSGLDTCPLEDAHL